MSESKQVSEQASDRPGRRVLKPVGTLPSFVLLPRAETHRRLIMTHAQSRHTCCAAPFYQAVAPQVAGLRMTKARQWRPFAVFCLCSWNS